MSACAGVFAVSCSREQPRGATTLQRERQLNQFLAEVERRALRIAEIGVRDRDEALDLVQDADNEVASVEPVGPPVVRWDEPYQTAASQLIQSVLAPMNFRLPAGVEPI